MNIRDQINRGYTVPRLLEALAHDQFVLYGQLIMPLGAPRESGGYIEVLVRYLEEEKTLLPPGGFFDVLESFNLMSMLDRWVLNRVIRSMVEQHEAQDDWNVPLYSVNLSVDSLYENEFPTLVHEYFRKYHLPKGKLRFEIDESDAQVHLDEVVKLASKLNPLGCGFTITSYTGASIPPDTLRALGVDAVKIGGGMLVAAAGRIPLHLPCRDHGVCVIADMVEEKEMVEQLTALGVDYVQGYAVCRPAPLRSLQKALK